MQVVLTALVIALTAAGLTAISLAVAQAWGIGKGLAIAVGAWIVMQLLRLGFEYDDGIDIKQLFLPAPFDWGVKVERERTRGANAALEIEGACRSLGADLIVMGAYSRNRLRQLVFGGVTEHMLFRTRFPVLTLHR